MPDTGERIRTYAAAVREALDTAMKRDASVIVIGEGVPDPKAIFGTTAGLRETYGSHRVFDMPLAENGLTGACIGAAIAGMRPVMIHQRIDFALLAMDQLVNNAAKWHYMFNGQASVPLVVRLLIGRGWGQGPQHSQSLQAMFAQVPGLKVVMPATPRDAKGMLLAAIEDDNPVLFIEHRWLHPIEEAVPAGPYLTPLDKARRLHTGDDVTVAAFSYMALEALRAAQALQSLGIGVDVLDMRSVSPLDFEAVVGSVGRTGRLVVADTAFRTGSVAGELVSRVAETAFAKLRTAPTRIASPDHPAPTSHFSMSGYYPVAQDVADAVLDQLGVDRESIDYARLRRQLACSRPHDVPNLDYTGPF